MQRVSVQLYVGNPKVDIAAHVHTMLEGLDDFLAFAPRGRAVNLPLSQHVSKQGYVVASVATHGFPQDDANLDVGRACVDDLRVAFNIRAKMINIHVMGH